MRKIVFVALLFLIGFEIINSKTECQDVAYHVNNFYQKDSTPTIIGVWGIYATKTIDTTFENGYTVTTKTETAFKGTTYMRFDTIGTGLHYNLEDSISFNWNIVDDQLLMLFNCDAINKPFGNDKNYYKFNIVQIKDYYELYIDIDKEKYILRRSISRKDCQP